MLLTERIEKHAGAARAAGIYYRRNLWLLLFGLAHGFLLWFGDFLVYYAVLALTLLYPLRRLSARTLLTLGLLVWIACGSFAYLRFFHVAATLRNDAQLSAAKAAGVSATPAQQAIVQADRKRQQAGGAVLDERLRDRRLGFLDGWPSRIATEKEFLGLVFSSFAFLQFFGAMITGMGLYKSGFLTNRRPVREYVLLAAAGYAVVLPLVLVGLRHLEGAGFTDAAFARWMAIPYDLEVVAGTLANASILLLLVRAGRLRSVFGPLAAVGRTALSNYILTTLICQFLFAWGPWKLYGKLEYSQWYLVVAAIWVVNLTLSPLWLRVFSFGPLEWLWRSLTYWRPQPMLLRRLPVFESKM